MGALLDQFAAEGVQIEAAGDDRIRASGNLTDATRTLIRAHKPAILAELGAANDAPVRQWRIRYSNGTAVTILFTPPATPAEVREVYPEARIVPIANAPKELPTPVDPDVDRRRNRALAILADEPGRHVAVVAEAGNPARVAVAIRGVGVGDLEIPAERYDGLSLLKLMEAHA